MRCPSCGHDADPANALCPYCHNALHLPAAPSSPYASGQPYAGGEPHPGSAPPYSGSQPYAGGQPYVGAQQPYAAGHEYTHAPYTPPEQHYVPEQGHGWSDSYQVLEPGPPPERSRASWGWLVAIIAVLIVAAGAAIAIVKLTGKHPHVPSNVLPSKAAATTAGPASTAPSPAGGDGKAQAIAIDQLLNASSASRQKLGPALTAVDGCGDLNGAVTTLQQVTAERDGQVKQGQSLAVDQLANGGKLQAALVQALTYSLQADQKYSAWAQAVAGAGCKGHAAHDDNYNAAQAASGSATSSKQQFVALWNPVAATYGLTARSEATV
jgi:hypothetical protein